MVDDGRALGGIRSAEAQGRLVDWAEQALATLPKTPWVLTINITNLS
jgi:hypothetical protein